MQAYKAMQAAFRECVRLRGEPVRFVGIPYEGIERPAAASLSNWLEHAMWVYGTSDIESTARAMAAQTLEGGIAESIRRPILITHGMNDKLAGIDQAQNMYEHATGSARRELKVFRADEGGVDHCGVDNWSIQVDYMADWVADVLQSNSGTHN